MRSSNDGQLGPKEPDAAPPLSPVADATGLAGWLHNRHDVSTTGDVQASRLGQISWALYEGARDPFVLLITIYMFAPYFANHVVGDGVRGQAYAGSIQAYSGLIIALLAPFLGAIADSGGRRKP